MRTNIITSLAIFIIAILVIAFIFVIGLPSLKEDADYYESIVVSISMVFSLPTIFFLFKDYQDKQQKRWEAEQLRLKDKEKFLNISIDTYAESEHRLIKTQIFNQTDKPQKIEYAFLLISEQDDWSGIIEHVNLKFGLNMHCTNDFIELKSVVEDPLWMSKYAGGFIPLSFYYKENIDISNESPSYVYSFDNRKVNLPAGIYSVRFYVFPDEGRYHISTVGSFIIP